MPLDDALRDSKILHGSVTVPREMIGCWKRRSFRLADGSEDNEISAIWVQTLSGVGDVRIAKSRPSLAQRDGFTDCSTEELMMLAEQDCFCGITLFDTLAKPAPTASWPKEAYLFRFQPLITFPEPGWIEWRQSDTCMIERAPSGAYEEDWRLQPDSQDFALHLTGRGSGPLECLCVSGAHAIYAKNRSLDLPSDKTLLQLASEAEGDRRFLETILDCEFSYARRARPGEAYMIETSTLPWREGKPLSCAPLRDLPFKVRSIEDLSFGEEWTVQGFWLP